jgi:hypothetical protein
MDGLGLRVLGTFAQAIVAEKIKGNRFVIRTSEPNVEVSWQVTGIRQDAFARKNRIKVEVDKDKRERGFYLHPNAFNLPEDRSVNSRLVQKQWCPFTGSLRRRTLRLVELRNESNDNQDRDHGRDATTDNDAGDPAAWCEQCAEEVVMLTPDDAATLLETTARAIFRSVEAGELHFRETVGGRLLVCHNSLERRLKQ